MRRNIAILLLVFLAAVSPKFADAQGGGARSSINISQVLTKVDIEAAVGGPLLDAKLDSNDLSIVRYFPQHGSTYLEAIVFSVRTFDTIEYIGLVDLAKKTGAYKKEIPGLGDKAFWQENISYGTLTVAKGRLLITLTVSQSNPPMTKLDAAIALAKLVSDRLHLDQH